jgi:hypothetical protein
MRRRRQTPTSVPRATSAEMAQVFENMYFSKELLAPSQYDAPFVRAILADRDKAARCYAAIVRSVEREIEEKRHD